MNKEQGEVLKAWIDGADIQANTLSGWYDVKPFKSSNRFTVGELDFFRIKPKVKKTWLWLADWGDGLDGRPAYAVHRAQKNPWEEIEPPFPQNVYRVEGSEKEEPI